MINSVVTERRSGDWCGSSEREVEELPRRYAWGDGALQREGAITGKTETCYMQKVKDKLNEC